MKRSVLLQLLAVGIVLTLGGVGCKSPQKGITALPERKVQAPPPAGGSTRVGPVEPVVPTNAPVNPVVTPTTPPRTPPNLGPGPGIGQGTPVLPDTGPGTTHITDVPPPVTTKAPDSESGYKQPDQNLYEGYLQDTNRFAADTVYFEFDSYVVRTSQQPNCNVVGDELKAKPETALLVDGHCDERGTEEYNRSLGERRALAIREYLIKYGIAPERIRTRTWGEDQPADPGHDDAAWSKNRRGEFILLLPPGK
jgi:peptidoglycan-associated lipoprotein